MAKTKKQTVEEPTAMDIVAKLKINVMSSPSVDFSVCAFGTEFINWKNYINSDLEKMKKEIYPKIGDIVTDHEGNSYKFTDIRLDEENTKDSTIPVYIFDLMNTQSVQA